jgi:hypothetical protein
LTPFAVPEALDWGAALDFVGAFAFAAFGAMCQKMTNNVEIYALIFS